MKNKKGFTLVEVIISMSIITIILAFCASMVVIISKISAKKEYDDLCLSEYQKASELVYEYKNAYSSNEFYLYSVNETEIIIKKNESDFVLSFNETTKTLTAQIYNYTNNQLDTKGITFKNITNINFISQSKMVKCTYQFENFNEYANLLNFGVNQ